MDSGECVEYRLYGSGGGGFWWHSCQFSVFSERSGNAWLHF